MAENTRVCAICGIRRPRRRCPGVEGDICPACCGTEREKSVACPLDCEYLREARLHDKLPDVNPNAFPHADIKVDEAFLRRNEPLLILIASSLARLALTSPGVIDNDVKDALASLVQTWRTLQSGLVYEMRPDNLIAAKLQAGVQETIVEIRRRLDEHHQTLRDADVLGILVFLQRMEIQHNNGRSRGRAFIDFLRGFFPPVPDKAPERDSGSGLILTP